MKLFSIIILLSIIISSLSIKKITVPINKVSDFKTSKICLNIGDQIELKVSKYSDIYHYYYGGVSTILNDRKNSNVYTAEKEGDTYFTFYRKEDDIKRGFYLLVDYLNLLRLKKYLYVKVSNEHKFLESECDNSRFEIKILDE